eukprot:TRINITY_DN6945_c0_g1_i1.p1 TRINITY_DN6945_c0_g1~~TRINITY_DN6945_c0_g1_i1.p1  ORF type:complete len:557 (+),score=158.50 TRINITY_DN6945_c0_g1_i1:56-1726(+)
MRRPAAMGPPGAQPAGADAEDFSKRGACRRRALLVTAAAAAAVVALPSFGGNSAGGAGVAPQPPPPAAAAEPLLLPPSPPATARPRAPQQRLRLRTESGGWLVGVIDEALVVGDSAEDSGLALQDGRILHASSGMAVGLRKPIGVGDPHELVLVSRADGVRFELHADGKLAEAGGARRSVHSWHGAYRRAGMLTPGTALVLAADSERRLLFEAAEAPPLGPPPPAPPPADRKRVVVATFVHLRKSAGDSMLDSAAVLTHRVWQMQLNPGRAFEYSLLVLLSNTSDSLRRPFDRLGWKVASLPLSVEPHDIRNPRISKEVWTDGAMGIWEMIKLEAWRPEVVGAPGDLHAVLMVDLDVHFRGSIEPALLPPWFPDEATLAYTQGAWPIEKLNGGFLVIRTGERTAEDYKNILALLREGDFRGGTGWKGAGYGWTYGGRTMQGLLPYYYIMGAGSGRARRLPRCVFNNMVNSDECKRMQPAAVRSNHFTGGCMKPWTCNRMGHALCTGFHDDWWKHAALAARALGTQPPSCRFGYRSMGLTQLTKWKPFWRPSWAPVR